MYEFIDKNGNISANSAKLVVIDKYGKVKEVSMGGGGSPTGPAGGDLSGTYPNPSVQWANGQLTYDLVYYPLSSNPAGYLTQDDVEEYTDLASFPVTGVIGTIYIALDTGLFYSWNGAAYVLSSPIVTGITGIGTTGKLPKFTSPTSIGDSNFRDFGATGGRYTNGSQYVHFVGSGSSVLLLDRGQSSINFALGNAGFGVVSSLYSTQSQEGLHIISEGDYVLRAGSGTPTVYNVNRANRNMHIGASSYTDYGTQKLQVTGSIRVTGAYYDSVNVPGTAGQILSSTATGTAWVAAPASVTPAPLTKTDDTNVTATLTGTSGTALLQAVNIALGWTGTLADSRITSAATWNAKADVIDNMFMNSYPTGSVITLNPYIGNISATAFSSNAANSNNYCRWQQIVTDIPLTIDEVYLSVVGTNAGASATLTLYFYDDNNGGLPGTKLQQEISSTGILTTGNKLVTFTSNITLQPGVYWVGIQIRGLDTAGTNPTFYFTSVGTDQKSYQAGAATFTNNYANTIFSSGSSDLVNNPTVSSSSATSLTVPMLKIKIG